MVWYGKDGVGSTGKKAERKNKRVGRRIDEMLSLSLKRET